MSTKKGIKIVEISRKVKSQNPRDGAEISKLQTTQILRIKIPRLKKDPKSRGWKSENRDSISQKLGIKKFENKEIRKTFLTGAEPVQARPEPGSGLDFENREKRTRPRVDLWFLNFH